MRGTRARAEADSLGGSDLTPAQRVRLLYSLGLQSALIGSPAHLDEAERHLVEAASQAGAAGLKRWQAQALASLAFNVHYLRGDLDRGAAAIRAALALCDPHSQQAAYAHIIAALIDIDYGHHADVTRSLSLARAMGLRLGNENILGFVAWTEAHGAAAREDQAGTILWLEEAERRTGTWFETVYGHVFLLDAAVMCGQVDDEARAVDYLTRAAARPNDVPQIMTGLVTALHAGRFGEPSAASRKLAAVLTSGLLPQRAQWQAQTLRALAEHRSGDAETARTLLADATALAEMVTDRGLPERLEPAAMRFLAAVAPDPGSPDEYRIRLLGAFELTRGGVVLPPPGGRAGELVAMVALQRGRRISIDEAAERLWPDAAPGAGRQRLRNVLMRIRSAAGDIVVRDRDDLVLAKDVVIDVEQFVRESTVARAADGPTRVDHARAALDYYIGDLLPSLAYAEWTVMPRDRLRARALAAHEIIAHDAERRGDLETAVHALARMHESDPLNERHPLRAARLLTAAGQPGRARAWWTRAEQICAELGLPLPTRSPAAAGGHPPSRTAGRVART